MKKKYIYLVVVFLIFLSCFIYYQFCKKVNVSPKELVGTYIMNCGSSIDTLIIYENHMFYHSLKSDRISENYFKTGTWNETVEGYYELINYSNALEGNSWDMKPYRCVNNNNIYIIKSADGQCKYYKLKK